MALVVQIALCSVGNAGKTSLSLKSWFAFYGVLRFWIEAMKFMYFLGAVFIVASAHLAVFSLRSIMRGEIKHRPRDIFTKEKYVIYRKEDVPAYFWFACILKLALSVVGFYFAFKIFTY